MHAPQAGFTLLEMLAAITVLALCCTVLLTAFGQSAHALQHVQVSDRLSLTARSLMDELAEEPLTAGDSNGVYGAETHWRMQVSLLPQANTRLTLYRLDLHLSEGRRTLHLSTLQLRVAGSGAL
jgi:general secretion pathway protein I